MAVVNVVDSPGFSKLRDHPNAVALVLKLLNDESPWIQGCLFRSLLERKEARPEAVVRALVGIVLDGKNGDDQGVRSRRSRPGPWHGEDDPRRTSPGVRRAPRRGRGSSTET